MSTIGPGGGPGDVERDPGLDRLYREAAREEPPARLDAAILAAAHREAGARPRPLSAPLRAWRVPVSIAAVVVLSVSLVTVMREEGGDQLAQPPAPRMESAPRNEGADRAKTPAKPPEQPLAPDPASSAPERAQAPAGKPAAGAALGQSAEVADAPQGELARARRAPEAASARSAAPAAPAAASAPPAPFVRDEPPKPLGAPTTAAGGPGEGETSGETSAEKSRRAAEAAKPAPAPRFPARMMAREAAPRADDRGGAMEDTAGALGSQAGVSATRPQARAGAGARKAAQPPADAAFVAAQLKELDAQPPERWIERLETLRREGRQAESDELLAEFRRRFPTHPLPAALRQAP